MPVNCSAREKSGGVAAALHISTMLAPAAAVRRLIFLLLFLLPFSAFAQSGMWGARGVSHAFLPRGSQVFDIDGRGVSVYDVSSPAQIRRVAVQSTSAESLDGAFLDATTLAVLTTSGIDRFGVSSSGALTLQSHLDAPGFQHLRASGGRLIAAGTNNITVYANDAAVAKFTLMSAITTIVTAGDALYVAQGQNGITVIDLTGVKASSVVAEVANDLVVDGGRLTIASGVDGLVVADISDPLAPRVTGRFGAGLIDLAHIAASGTRAYGTEAPDVVDEFDVSDPTSPRLVALTHEMVTTMTADAAHLFVSGSIIDKFGLAVETGMPLRILDPVSLDVAGTFADLAGPVSGVATDGTLAYVMDHPFFRVIDVSTTSAPRELASIPIPDADDFVKVRGNQVILFGRGDVDLVDVSNPYDPRLLNTYHSLGPPTSRAAFTRTYIVEGNSLSGFHVMDFEHYTPPGQVGGIKTHYHEVASNNLDAVYASGEGQAFVLVDMTDPHNPHATRIAALDVRQIVYVAASEHHGDLLLVRSPDGIRVYGIADPLHPVPISFVPMTGTTEVAGDGDKALVATADGIVQLDLTDPVNPQAIPSGLSAFLPMQIGIGGAKTVIADRYGLRVFGPNTAPPPPQLHRRAARP